MVRLPVVAAGEAGALRVGTYQSVSRQVLPRLLRRFGQVWPRVDLRVSEEPTDEQLKDAVWIVLSLPTTGPMLLDALRSVSKGVSRYANPLARVAWSRADLILVHDRVLPTVERLLRDHRPHVVGLSIMTFQRRTALRLVDLPGYGYAQVSHDERQQWRALIDLLGREANALPTAEKRAKQADR